MISLPREAWAAIALLLALSILGFVDLAAIVNSFAGWVGTQLSQWIDSLIPSAGDLLAGLNPF